MSLLLLPLNPSSSSPLLSLSLSFTLWKSFLLLIALAPTLFTTDYDTSTSLFFAILYPPNSSIPALASRLTRWDALYFMRSARTGYVYEQDWAFALGLPKVVTTLGAALDLDLTTSAWEPLVAIVVAHASHLIAVLSLYQLTLVVCKDKRLAYLASTIHILSPAGLFLSAPYAESPFSCLSFVGNLLFALGFKTDRDSLRRNACVVAAGLVFGLSSTFRSNGIFSGLLFAVEAVQCGLAFVNKPTFSHMMRLVAPVVGGILVAAGLVVPQALAYMRYCMPDVPEAELRPWCTRTIPSIYTFVQEEYWNVGFLRYWTPNQIPLFLLAAPMLTILIKSGTAVLLNPSPSLTLTNLNADTTSRTFIRTLAAMQTILAVLAITNYHVQIISRVSSGYPVWCWWVASCLMDKKRQGWGYGITVFIVMYASIQGALFASFLPPA
ncbi:GPI mannosyltransferase 2 [Thelonectria olida]|uniref:GPI mannosyltransferase 2 n=1 Tax=Thelonectria olida TaxID=1576542 RepID=A0A9P8W1C1_9HYPO|nr:GPI mannosyltransferase 2 [Thelonectria olida]